MLERKRTSAKRNVQSSEARPGALIEQARAQVVAQRRPSIKVLQSARQEAVYLTGFLRRLVGGLGTQSVLEMPRVWHVLTCVCVRCPLGSGMRAEWRSRRARAR